MLPQELNGILDAGQWNFIITQMNAVTNESNLTACLVEGLVCCVCAFPLFCCHPCVARQFELYKRQESVHLINLNLFNGSPVVQTTADGNNLIINTAFLNQVPMSIVPIHAVPAYAQAQYTQAQYSSATVVNPAYVAPSAVETRQFTITIPANCTPGSILTVLSPQGTQVQVTCPPDVKPGSVITVSY